MASQKITNFFQNNNVLNESNSESDSDDDLAVFNGLDKDINEYEKILSSKNQIKEKSKIVLTKKSSGGSVVWHYFGQLVIANKPMLKKFQLCKVCFDETPMRLKGFGVSTSTTNLCNHLRSAHGIEVKSKNTETSNAKTKSVLSGKSKMLDKSDTEKFANARLLVQMCCRDLRPFNIVEQPGFIGYIKAIKPNMTLPSSTTLSRSALEDVYGTYKTTISKFLNNQCPVNISLVLDMWTDSYKRRSFINIRILFCQNFETKCISLKTEIFPHPHNKQTICQNVYDTLKNFELEKKEIVVVSDGGSNIVAALKLAKMNRLPCSIHSLHRFIVHDILCNNDFYVFANMVSKLKRIYKCLNYNTDNIIKIQNAFENEALVNLLSETTEMCDVMETEQQFLMDIDDVDEKFFRAQPPGTLKNCNDTRWNTLCTMFKSFHRNIKVVNIALLEIGKSEMILNEMEKSLMEEFLKFLEIFEEATKYLQGRKYPTVNTNIVFFEKISDSIEQNLQSASFEESIKIYTFATENFSNRFKIYKIHLVAAVLDPLQKNWKRLEKWLKKVPAHREMSLFEILNNDDINGGISKTDLILKEIRKFSSEDINDDMPTTSTNAKKRKLETGKIRSNIASFITETSTSDDVNPLEKEIKDYFASSHDEECEAFTWWQNNEKQFPNVAKLASSILCIPSTSASSEEAFSSAGSLVTAKRSNLSPLTINRVLFIHDNYEIFNSLV